MYCDTNQFPALPFFGPHKKPRGTRGLSKNYHLCFYPKLGHGICAIRRITCACVRCTSTLDKHLISVILSNKHARYQPVTNCTYSPVLGSYNNWNIIHITPKSTPFEAFYEIHKVVIDRISENMASLFQSGMCGSINTDDITTNGLYVIQFVSEAYTLQNNTTISGQVISSGELVVKAQYIFSMQENNNCYLKQQPLQQTIIVPTFTMIHPRLDVITIRDVQDIPKNVCNTIHAKKDLQRHPICMTDADYDYILDEIEHREKLSLNGM